MSDRVMCGWRPTWTRSCAEFGGLLRRVRPVVDRLDLGQGDAEHDDGGAAEQRERANEPEVGPAEPCMSLRYRPVSSPP